MRTTIEKPAFTRVPLSQLFQHGVNGFQQTTGFHIYCELRPTSKLELTNNDDGALKYARVIEEFVNHGVDAATPFRMALLELQENVLHFYKESDLTVESAIEAIQFVYLFTTTLYEELKPDLQEGWDGFASCIDHGAAILVRHQSIGNSSTVSLGPCANRPAKQLLYGKTPAGCVDIPGSWAKALELSATGNWLTINLRNREKIPFAHRMDNAVLRNQLLERMRAYRANKNRPRISSIAAANKIQGAGIQADLDGFSATIQKAFNEGGSAVEKVAFGFARILEFGDYMRNSTPGSFGLPWAGDLAPTIVPKKEWLAFAMRWQNFARATSEGEKRGWANVFPKVGWAIGACHGITGSNIAVPIEVQGRTFLIATGWAITMAMDAQNLGKSGEIVTHNLDYSDLDSAARRLFTKIDSSEFWKTTNINPEKIKNSAIDLGRETGPGRLQSSKYGSVTVPVARPYYQ